MFIPNQSLGPHNDIASIVIAYAPCINHGLKEPNWANFHDFLMGEVRYLSVKKAYPNEAEELHSRASSPTRSLSLRLRREEPRD